MTATNIAFATSIRNLPERVISKAMANPSGEETRDKKIVLAFDLYGTILSTSSISHALSKHFGEEKASSIATTWRTQQLEYTWRLNSMGQYQPFSAITRQSLAGTLASYGESLNEKDTENILNQYNNLHIFPDVAEALTALPSAPDLAAYIFTNGTDDMVQSSLKQSPDLGPLAKVFKDIVTVEEVRAFKPAPDVYWHLLARVGKQREQCGEVWLVSGNPFDVVGAASIGLRTCWVDREGNGWADACIKGTKPDFIVRGLGEVIEGVRKFSQP